MLPEAPGRLAPGSGFFRRGAILAIRQAAALGSDRFFGRAEFRRPPRFALPIAFETWLIYIRPRCGHRWGCWRHEPDDPRAACSSGRAGAFTPRLRRDPGARGRRGAGRRLLALGTCWRMSLSATRHCDPLPVVGGVRLLPFGPAAGLMLSAALTGALKFGSGRLRSERPPPNA